MKAIILVAGFATRLESVTNNGEIAKTLLPITAEGKTQPILHFILDKIIETNIAAPYTFTEVVVMTNEKYFDQIDKSCDKFRSMIDINVYTNGIKSKDDVRRGANLDLQRASSVIDSGEDVMILAGDNYFNFKLEDFIKKFDKKADNSEDQITMLASKRYPKSKRNITHNNFGILELNGDRVISLIEKPLKNGIDVDSDEVCMACYLMSKRNLNLIDEFLAKYEEGDKHRDSLGYFINYLIKHTETYDFSFSGKFVDIGTPEQYKKMIKNNENLVEQ